MAKNHDETPHVGGGLVGGSLVRGNWGDRTLIRRDNGPRGLERRGLDGRGLAEALDALATGSLDKDLSHINPYIDRLARADPGDVQEVAASQLQLLVGHHRTALAQSRRCFFWALVAAGIGFIFFFSASLYGMATGNVAAALVPVLAGIVVEAMACLLFYTHGRTTAESSRLRDTLEAVQRHLLANSVCEGLSGDRKEQTRADLARKIANIPTSSFLTVPSQRSSGDDQTPLKPPQTD
jgi:hypothetical protein